MSPLGFRDPCRYLASDDAIESQPATRHDRTAAGQVHVLCCAFLIIGILAPFIAPVPSWAQSPAGDRRALDAAIIEAQALEVPLLAPKGYDEAKRRYEAVDAALRRSVPIEQLRAEIERATTAAHQAARTATQVRALIGELLSGRAALLALDASMPAAAGRADELLRDAAVRAEAGDRAGASRAADQAMTELARIGAAVVREKKFASTRRLLEQLRGAAPQEIMAAALHELEGVERSLRDQQSGIAGVIVADKRLEEIIVKLFPLFYRDPPMTLVIDGFTLHVEKYETRSWDFNSNAIVKASGTAWTSFDCGPKVVHPFPLDLTILKTFRVVETVRDAASEISVEKARRFAPNLKFGETLDLRVPKSAATAFEVAQAIDELVAVQLKPKGDIRVRFEERSYGGYQASDFIH